MSEAAAAAAPAPAGKGKKKLIIIIAAVLVLVAGGGGAFVVMSKNKAAAAEEEGGAEAGHGAPAKAAAAPKAHSGQAPTFVPLEPFTVNLADRDADRYAQIGITLEFSDAKLGDQVKIYMPAIRNNVLLAIADRTAGDLLGRDGKAKLARKVAMETSKALGFEVEDDEDEAAAEDDEHKPAKKGGKKKKKRAPAPLPVTGVHFSNFIIQ